LGLSASVKPAVDANHLAKYLDIPCHDGLISIVLRLQAHIPVLPEKPLYGGFLTQERHHDVSVDRVRLLPHDHVVPVQDACLDHAVAPHLEQEQLAGTSEFPGQREVALDVFHRQDRLARGDPADDRRVDDAAGWRPAGLQDLNGARLRRVPADIALFLQLVEMAVHGGAGAQTDGLPDLPHRRGIAPLLYFPLDELEDLPLPWRQVIHRTALP